MTAQSARDFRESRGNLCRITTKRNNSFNSAIQVSRRKRSFEQLIQVTIRHNFTLCFLNLRAHTKRKKSELEENTASLINFSKKGTQY